MQLKFDINSWSVNKLIIKLYRFLTFKIKNSLLKIQVLLSIFFYTTKHIIKIKNWHSFIITKIILNIWYLMNNENIWLLILKFIKYIKKKKSVVVY